MKIQKIKYHFVCKGYGLVTPKKVRVYHRFWRWFLPAKVRLDWNDEDAIPFVYYQDLKDRLLLGVSDERLPDLFNKIEHIRFNYPDILLMGRLWTKRKIIVFDQLSFLSLETKYVYLDDFTKIAAHYLDDIKAYQIVLPKTGCKGYVDMNTICNVIEECFWGPDGLRASDDDPSNGKMRKLKLVKTLY